MEQRSPDILYWVKQPLLPQKWKVMANRGKSILVHQHTGKFCFHATGERQFKCILPICRFLVRQIQICAMSTSINYPNPFVLAIIRLIAIFVYNPVIFHPVHPSSIKRPFLTTVRIIITRKICYNSRGGSFSS